jgi:hypothetical protein
MCGIAGCLALAIDAGPDQAWVANATQRITHRGPDDEGFYSDHDVALGYKRLAIIDLSQGGHQPMRSADGRYWMVFNGEIYNYLELGAELREQGVVLRSSCDSEVLLETYARIGKDVVQRLRGMFAFAIWDSWTRELFCARDQFGIKPFYYSLDPGPLPSLSPRGGRHAAPGPAADAGEPTPWPGSDAGEPAPRPGSDADRSAPWSGSEAGEPAPWPGSDAGEPAPWPGSEADRSAPWSGSEAGEPAPWAGSDADGSALWSGSAAGPGGRQGRVPAGGAR